MSNPVYLALDTPNLAHAGALATAVRDHVGGIKLGLEFFAANGPAGVAALSALGLPVFLDLKLHDIPNTVGKAVAALAGLSPAVLTVHAIGGSAMLAAAKAAAPPTTKVVAVTVLTSLDVGDLSATGIDGSVSGQVERLAALTRGAGLDGVVCSSQECAAVRTAWPDSFRVIPGVRMPGDASGDQKRIMTPREALAAGASIIVVGRPITLAADPAAAARAIAASL